MIDHEENLEMTQNVMEAMYKNDVKNIAFASTSSVYGDATIHPTPEEYQFEPTSLYGATKAAAESYIRVYASYYGMKSFIFRFVSFIGERYTHGIMVVIHVAHIDDAPGAVLVGLLCIFAPLVTGVFAAVLHRLLRSALDLKSENDLTV
jgi:nucleoside-diphosphate-sugar epimerase